MVVPGAPVVLVVVVPGAPVVVLVVVGGSVVGGGGVVGAGVVVVEVAGGAVVVVGAPGHEPSGAQEVTSALQHTPLQQGRDGPRRWGSRPTWRTRRCRRGRRYRCSTPSCWHNAGWRTACSSYH